MPWETENQKMGFEGVLFYGVAGSQASTRLTNTRDITLEMGNETGETTVRGDGIAPPIKTESVTQRIVGLEFVMVNDSTDESLEAIKMATAGGYPVALRGKDHASGKGPDADFNVKYSHPWPLNGEQVVTVTATPNRGRREPQSYV